MVARPRRRLVWQQDNFRVRGALSKSHRVSRQNRVMRGSDANPRRRWSNRHQQRCGCERRRYCTRPDDPPACLRITAHVVMLDVIYKSALILINDQGRLDYLEKSDRVGVPRLDRRLFDRAGLAANHLG
jgi:hypothetical protein